MVGLGATMGLFRVVHGAPYTYLMLGRGITFEGIWILEEPHTYHGGGYVGGNNSSIEAIFWTIIISSHIFLKLEHHPITTLHIEAP
jgi:hypothetical protein